MAKDDDYSIKMIRSILILIFGISCCFCLPFFSPSNLKNAQSTADGFTISSYNVVLDVKSDLKIDVIENIVVNWEENGHHGIYKFTPLWLEYTDKNEKTIKRKANISNYQAVGEPYSLDNINKKARIRIGDASKYVSTGEKKYVIKYTYDMGSDPYKGFDELIFHAYGDYWGTIINNASVEINMPKNIEDYDINFFTDKYRKNDVTDIVDYTVNGNKIYATFNENKNKLKNKENYEPLTKSLTVDIALPEGYFTKGSFNYGWYSFIITIIIFILTIWTIFNWFKYGKNYEKGVLTVEFYPPDNLNPAEVGYVYNKKHASNKLTIALIIELASKGYIKIDEVKDKEENIKITNMLVKPKSLKNNSSLENLIEVQKLKDVDDKLNQSETTVMIHLFKNGNRKIVDNNFEEFFKVKDKLINDGYIEIVNVKDEEKKEIEEYEKKLSKVPALSKMEEIVYERLFLDEDEIILSKHTTLYHAFEDVENELNNNFKDKIDDINSRKQINMGIIRNEIILLLSMLSYFYIEDLDPKLSIMYYLAFSCIFINLLFVIFMGRKTKYGEYITAKVKSFRNFLETVEKEQLEALVLKNPKYFYNILPYTYVLGISKKWISKFENISYPKINMGSFNYSSDLSFSNLYDNVYYPSNTSSSGCSSCGGGCSSCGGGCSSCGGGGSW